MNDQISVEDAVAELRIEQGQHGGSTDGLIADLIERLDAEVGRLAEGKARLQVQNAELTAVTDYPSIRISTAVAWLQKARQIKDPAWAWVNDEPAIFGDNADAILNLLRAMNKQLSVAQLLSDKVTDKPWGALLGDTSAMLRRAGKEWEDPRLVPQALRLLFDKNAAGRIADMLDMMQAEPLAGAPPDYPIAEAVKGLREAAKIYRWPSVEGVASLPVYGDAAGLTADWLELQHAELGKLQDKAGQAADRGVKLAGSLENIETATGKLRMQINDFRAVLADFDDGLLC